MQQMIDASLFVLDEREDLPYCAIAMDKFQLLSQIAEFQKRHGMSDYALGMAAARDGHLIRRLREDKIKDPKLSTVKKILDAMQEKDRMMKNGKTHQPV